MVSSPILKADLKEIDLWNHELSSMDAPARIEWAINKFGDGVVTSTSFGLQSAVMTQKTILESIDSGMEKSTYE